MDIDNNAGVILEKIKGVAADVGELRLLFQDHDKREREFQAQYWERHAEVKGKAEAAHSRIDDLSKQVGENKELLRKFNESLQPLIQANKIVTWVGVTLGGSIVLLVWLIIIGKVTLVGL